MAKNKESISTDEQETTFTIEGADHKTLYVFSNDLTWTNKLDKMVTSYRQDGYGKFYELNLKDYTFTLRPKRKMSSEERKASGVRLQTARKLKETGVD